MTPTALYMLLCHCALAAHLAVHRDPFAASPAARAATTRTHALLQAAIAELRDVMGLHGLDAADVTATMRSRVETTAYPWRCLVAALLTLPVPVTGSAIVATLEAHGINVDALTAALPSLREALYPAPWANLARAEKARADAWAACASTWAGFAEPDAERHPDVKAACDRVNETVREAIRLRTICGPVPAEDSGHDPDAAPYTLSPLASEPVESLDASAVVPHGVTSRADAAPLSPRRGAVEA